MMTRRDICISSGERNNNQTTTKSMKFNLWSNPMRQVAWYKIDNSTETWYLRLQNPQKTSNDGKHWSSTVWSKHAIEVKVVNASI